MHYNYQLQYTRQNLMFSKINIIQGLDTKECNVLQLKTYRTLIESHIVGYLSTFCFNYFKPLDQVSEPIAHDGSVQLNSSKFTIWIRVCNSNSTWMVLCWRPRIFCLLACIIAVSCLKTKQNKRWGSHLYLILTTSWCAKAAWNILNKQNNIQQGCPSTHWKKFYLLHCGLAVMQETDFQNKRCGFEAESGS